MPSPQILPNPQSSQPASALEEAALAARLEGLFSPAPWFCVVECASTFDLGWELARQNRLPFWGAVTAQRQSAGRGQLRRAWHSPEGNLYVSFRLPLGQQGSEDRVFSEESASVLAAFLCLRALRGLGLEVSLKWPNDLVLPLAKADGGEGGYGKLGGILLEERDGVLLLGLGLNCLHVPPPQLLRADASMPAVALPGGFFQDKAEKSALRLWSGLVPRLIMEYDNFFKPARKADLLREAEAFLVWKGRNVRVREPLKPGKPDKMDGTGQAEEAPLEGELLGLSARGGLCLRTRKNGLDYAVQEIFSGSPVPIE